ncbi:unnamed protein product [Arabidopsis thaliana]|uniref:(thale cress) hypothetical protein n=1 Tax=Arabidopsis thaliana TaxID=3702 RepID=A0A7G2DQC5_ARATH|nr:unnamed protein product [Arabidopsis thaliana]
MYASKLGKVLISNGKTARSVPLYRTFVSASPRPLQVTKMTKDVTEKVTETTDTITEKAKGSVSGVLGTAKNATDIIKNKILGGD